MKRVCVVGEAIAETAHDELKAADAQRYVCEICRVRFPERTELPRSGRQQIEKDRFDRAAAGQPLFNIGKRGAIVVSQGQRGELFDLGRKLFDGFSDLWCRRATKCEDYFWNELGLDGPN